jgi:hypothetical protein
VLDDGKETKCHPIFAVGGLVVDVEELAAVERGWFDGKRAAGFEPSAPRRRRSGRWWRGSTRSSGTEQLGRMGRRMVFEHEGRVAPLEEAAAPEVELQQAVKGNPELPPIGGPLETH